VSLCQLSSVCVCVCVCQLCVHVCVSICLTASASLHLCMFVSLFVRVRMHARVCLGVSPYFQSMVVQLSIFLGGVILSRCGLWGFDLAEVQIMQTFIDPSVLGRWSLCLFLMPPVCVRTCECTHVYVYVYVYECTCV
jgi:Ferroportin1 (FPN1)